MNAVDTIHRVKSLTTNLVSISVTRDLFSGLYGLTNFLYYFFALTFLVLYFFSIFFAPFREIVALYPQSGHQKLSGCLFPSAPQQEQMPPVPLELISTSSMEWSWHLKDNRSLTYPLKFLVIFLFADFD